MSTYYHFIKTETLYLSMLCINNVQRNLWVLKYGIENNQTPNDIFSVIE